MATAVAASPPTARAEKMEPSQLERKIKWFRAFETNKTQELEEARVARQYYHDKQWTDGEIERLKARGQQATVRNRIKRKVDFLVGVEQRLRRDPKAYPRTPQHEADADTATASLRYVCDANKWPSVSSEAMHKGLVSGIGVVFIGIEGQDPKLVEVPEDRFFYDPRSIKPDFSDARYMGLHLWLDTDEAKEKWPEKAEQLEQMMDADGGGTTTSIVEQDRDQQWGDFENRRIRVVEFWEKKLWNGQMNGSTAMTPPRARMAWYFCFFTGNIELESGMSPYLDEKGTPDNPYEAWSPWIDEKGTRYGLVRTLKSIQDEVNYSASKMLHRISVRQMFYKDGSVEDVDDFSKQMARPDGKLKIAPHAEWGKDVGPVDDMKALQGEAERHQLAVQEMENYGPNPGLVGQGQGVDGASGRALLAQRDSGMTEMQPIFERQREWKLRCYRKMWDRVRQAWNAERFIRVTDVSNAIQFVPINSYEMDPMTGQIQAQNVVAEIDVDISLDEGPDTITMNEELMDQFTKLGEAAMSPLGMIVLELSNTPKKDELKKMIEEGMQAMQPGPDPALQAKMEAEQMKAQADQAKMQADMEMKQQEQQARIAEMQMQAELELQKLQIDAQLEAEKAERDSRMKQMEFAANMQMKEAELMAERQRQEFEREKHEAEMARADRMHAQKIDELQESARTTAATASAGGGKRGGDSDMKSIGAMLSAPKRVIRDKAGRVVGVETVMQGTT